MTTVDFACPNCAAPTLKEFYRVDGIPVNSCLVVDNEAEGRGYPTGDLRIAVCEQCGLIVNTAFDLNRLRYDPAYEETQIYSATFNAFQDRLIARLVREYDLHGKTVIDIGCGKGDFLARMAQICDIRGIGIDPSAVTARLSGVAAERVRFINEFYGPQHADIPADIIFCRHALEHIPDIHGLLRMVRDAVGDRPIPIVFELPETMRVLRERAYWDMYFEHCNYFTPGSLARSFETAGFQVTDVRVDYDEQYLILEARASRGRIRPYEAVESAREVVEAAADYEIAIERRFRAWREHFADARNSQKRIALWGSGSKAVAFMSTLGVDEEVAMVGDINPYRHGKFLIGTGKTIASPEQVAALQPDEVVVMNPIYEAEVTSMLRSLGSDARVITAESPLEEYV